MRLTKQTDYALVLLTLMAAEGEDGVHAARDLAESSRIPLPMVGKILKLLTRERLLVSHRGASGGYSLAANPAKVTIARVIAVMEGPIAITACSTGNGSACPLQAGCPTCDTLQQVNRTVVAALEGISLLDMARPRRSPGRAAAAARGS